MHTTITKPANSIIIELSFCCFGFTLFSFFIHAGLPLLILSFAGLSISGYIISRKIDSFRDFLRVFCITFPPRIILFLIAGLLLGLTYAIIYRKVYDIPLFPGSLHQFALTAMLIGGAEELIFRGFIQEYAGKINIKFAVVFASLAHTAYKCCLFLFPVINPEINIGNLLLVTFISGILLGLLKEISKSVLPALAAHMLFDVLVYGECLHSPWWVW